MKISKRMFAVLMAVVASLATSVVLLLKGTRNGQ